MFSDNKIKKSQTDHVFSNIRFCDHDVLPSISCTILPEWVDYFDVSHLFLKESILCCQGEQLAQADVAGSSQLGRAGLFLLDLAVLTDGSQKFGMPEVKSVHMIYLSFPQKFETILYKTLYVCPKEHLRTVKASFINPTLTGHSSWLRYLPADPQLKGRELSFQTTSLWSLRWQTTINSLWLVFKRSLKGDILL